jgi:hypothetical protein
VLRPASDGCPGTVEAESTHGRRSGAAGRQATGRSYGSPGSSCRGNGGNRASDPAPATSDASAVGPSRADGGCPADGASNSGGDHPPTVLSAVESDRLRALLHTTRGPRSATPADTMRMGNAARALSSVALWHSLTNSDHWARPVTSLAAGSGPAPIVTGSSSATIAASDPRPGPQVPPTAGGGSAVRRPAIAKAAPKRPRQTRTSPVRQAIEGRFTRDHLSCGPMVGVGLPGGDAGQVTFDVRVVPDRSCAHAVAFRQCRIATLARQLVALCRHSLTPLAGLPPACQSPVRPR